MEIVYLVCSILTAIASVALASISVYRAIKHRKELEKNNN